MRMRFVASAMLMAMVAAGCASNGPTSTYQELGQDANTRGFGRRYPQDPGEAAFVFGVGDAVRITVDQFPELSADQVIRQDGMITLPIVNDVQAAGLTTDGLRKKIELRLAAFIESPRVTIGVGVVRSKGFYVAANNPFTGGTILRRVPYQGDTLLLDVYAMMGSPSSALDDDCHMTVIKGDPRHPRKLVVNVRDIVENGYTGGNIQIQPDDIVLVPPSWLGRLNAAIAGIALPFQSLFSLTRTIVAVDYTVRVIEGDVDDNNGLALGGLFYPGFGGGYGGFSGGGYGGYPSGGYNTGYGAPLGTTGGTGFSAPPGNFGGGSVYP